MFSYVRFFFFSSRRRHTRYWRDWSSDVCSSDLRDRERAALDFVLPQLPRARAFGEVSRLAGDLADALLLDPADDGDDQTVLERDGDPDVGALVQDELAVGPAAVELRVLEQRERCAADDEVVDAHLLAVVGERL